jgi:aromatic-L-amino-acid decarboxylase
MCRKNLNNDVLERWPFMINNLTLGDSRKAVLAETMSIVTTIWEGFDAARDVETAVSETTVALLSESLPEQGTAPETALNQATEVLDQSMAQSRPRFLAYIGSSGLEIGAVADFLAASYDINVALDARASSALEVQTSRWLGEFIGYSNAQGLFTSGGTISNITALAAARHRTQPSVRELGITTPMAVYCSAEAHYSNKRAVELLGLGSRAIRSIPIDDHHRLIPEELEAQIVDDLANGIQPMAIIANAGTTLTGAIDPLRAIAEIAARHGVWLHVDGAYGVPAAGTALVGNLFDGLDLADSVTIDAHKWLFVPKACSIVLVKDYEALAATFGHNEAYMPHAGTEPNPVDVTLEYSRPLRALKMWLGFKAHGASGFRDAIEENIGLARMTFERAASSSSYRTLSHAPQLSIVPLQHIPHGMTDPALISEHNARLCAAIVEDGRVYLSPAVIEGEVWLRPCFTNFRTRPSDVDVLFTVIEELGASVAGLDRI